MQIRRAACPDWNDVWIHRIFAQSGGGTTRDRVGLGDACDLSEMLTSEALRDLGQRAPLWIGQPDASGRRAENSILRDQVFTLEEKALVDQACDICP